MSKPQPDEFISGMGKVIHFLQVYKKQFFGAGLLILLVALGLMGLHYYNERQKLAWADLIYKADQLPAADRMHQYESLVNKAGPSGLKALLYLELGRFYQENGKGEEALRSYQKASEASFPLVRDLGWLALAGSYEEQGKYSEAKDSYRRMLAQTKGSFIYLAKLGLIRVNLAMGQGEEAKTLIQELQKTADLPPEIKTALQERQALLLLEQLKK